MSRLDQAANDARRRLLKLEDVAMLSIVRSYRDVYTALTARLDQLTTAIERARARGETINEGWLYRQERYAALAGRLEVDLAAVMADAARAATTAQDAAVAQALTDAPWLTRIAAGGAPVQALERIDRAFKTLPSEPLAALIGIAADNRPLGLLFAEIAPDGARVVTSALAEGVAAGFGPRETARHVRKAAGVPLTRALTVTRTEMTRAYRGAAQDRYRRSGVVAEWTWHAQLDNRTCPLCVAMHGTRHPTAETLDSHPNCRCAMVPRTASWADLGFPDIPDRQPTIPTGESLFARLPAAQQRQILGPAKHQLYANGHIRLGDLVRETSHPRWGRGRRVASLHELQPLQAAA